LYKTGAPIHHLRSNINILIRIPFPPPIQISSKYIACHTDIRTVADRINNHIHIDGYQMYAARARQLADSLLILVVAQDPRRNSMAPTLPHIAGIWLRGHQAIRLQ